MSFQIFTQPSQQALDTAANVLSGATLTFSLTGTSTPTNAYSDSALTTPVANPLSANAAGVWIPIFLDPTVSYRVVLKTQAGAVLQTWDPANENLLTQALIGLLLYPRTAAEIAASVTPVNYAYPSGYVQRYGAVGNGSVDDTAAIQNALNAVGAKGTIILEATKTYKITQQLTLCRTGATGPDGIVCNDGVATLLFSGLSATTDCILIGFASNTDRQPVLRNLILDAQGTAGQDIISIRRDEHGRYENLLLKNSVRDAFSMCPQADFDQVENPQLYGVHVFRAGRHAFASIVGAATTVGPFVNELTGINCEVRGYSWLVANGAAWYHAVHDNHGGAGIQDHTWIGCNVNVDDGQGAPAHTPLPGLAYADYDAAGSNIITHIDFYGGGWETSLASVLKKAARNASLGNTTDNWHLVGQNVFNVDGVTNPGVNWTWDEGNSFRRNGFDYRIGTVCTMVWDPGASGSGTLRMDRSGVTKAQIILDNEFGQAFWDGESSITYRRFSDALTFLLLDFANTRINFATKVYLPQDSGVTQSSCAIYAGTGVPSNANGANGDYYHRSDTPGTANQRIYVKSAGAWVGIV